MSDADQGPMRIAVAGPHTQRKYDVAIRIAEHLGDPVLIAPPVLLWASDLGLDALGAPETVWGIDWYEAAEDKASEDLDFFHVLCASQRRVEMRRMEQELPDEDIVGLGCGMDEAVACLSWADRRHKASGLRTPLLVGTDGKRAFTQEDAMDFRAAATATVVSSMAVGEAEWWDRVVVVRIGEPPSREWEISGRTWDFCREVLGPKAREIPPNIEIDEIDAGTLLN